MEAKLWTVDSMPWEIVNPSFERRLVHGERTMLAFLHLHRGCQVPRHSHHNEQASYVIEGRLRFLVGAEQMEEVVVGPGQVLFLPSHLPHSAEALEDTRGIDVFTPPRQDWLDGTDEYLRR
ncbi:MAG TPA: cupin domain-containing protein [Thermoanaerobaculia bacterium]|nr:cupin domain-containing protein [Thermoanaerobaculia bacterium]